VSDWRWVSSDVVYAIHDRQLDEHGGLDGVRYKGAIESALVKPQNLVAYTKPDVAALAAAYAFVSQETTDSRMEINVPLGLLRGFFWPIIASVWRFMLLMRSRQWKWLHRVRWTNLSLPTGSGSASQANNWGSTTFRDMWVNPKRVASHFT
jgi:hypothetical protein